MHDVVSAPKRKRLEESSINVDSYKCPFGGIAAAKVLIDSSTVTDPVAGVQSSPFEALPYETFLHIVSYLGPSTSLTSMSCVSQRYNRFMRRIGDVMLTKAKNCFRYPLKSNNSLRKESSISIFVRYSSYCSHVHKRLEILDSLLSSSHITGTCHRECKKRPRKRFSRANKGSFHNMQLSRAFISTPDIDEALDIAEKLISKLSNSISSPDQHMCCSRSLEARVLATVGKIGGAVFKHSKVALEMIQQESVGASNGNIDDSSRSGMSRELEKDVSLDIGRIDKARLLMQKVVFYKLLFECNGKKT